MDLLSRLSGFCLRRNGSPVTLILRSRPWWYGGVFKPSTKMRGGEKEPFCGVFVEDVRGAGLTAFRLDYRKV